MSLKRAIAACVLTGALVGVPMAAKAQVPPRQESPTQAAQRMVREASTAVLVAQNQVKIAKAKVAEGFKTTNPDYAKAEQDVAKAKGELDLANANALKTVRASQPYQAAAAGKEAARARLSEITAAKGSPLQLDAATQDYTRNAAELSRLERTADSDPAVREAKTKFAEATRAMEGFKAQLEQAYIADQECIAADQALVQAQQAELQAKEAVKQAMVQEREARKSRTVAPK